MDDLKNLLYQTPIPLTLAFIGGMLRLGQKRKHNPHISVFSIVVDLSISAFAGFLTFCLMAGSDLAPGTQAICLSISGYIGPAIVKLFSDRAFSIISSLGGDREK